MKTPFRGSGIYGCTTPRRWTPPGRLQCPARAAIIRVSLSLHLPFGSSQFHWLSFGLNHSYFDSLPTFDPNLLGTTLLDKYIFQGLSVDARFELPYRISLFTQLGRSKSIADAKEMWNKMYGVSFGNILKIGFSCGSAIFTICQHVRTRKLSGAFRYREASRTRFQLDLVAGSQSLVSDSTTNTSSHFVTGSRHVEPGSTIFL